MSGHAIIIGAGQIGLRCADELMAGGWSVDLLARHLSADAPESVQQVMVDRTDATDLVRAIGPGADLLIDTVAFNKAEAEQLVALAGSLGAIAVISSAAVYCDAEGRTMDQANGNGFPHGMTGLTTERPTVRAGDETYATRKIAMEQALLAGAPDKTILIRPCAIHGTHSRHPREWWFVKRMLDQRRRIPLAYAGSSRFQTTSTGAIARLIESAMQSGARGIFDCADADSPSVLEIGEMIAAHLGTPTMFEPLDEPVGATGRTPWTVPLSFTVSNASGSSFAKPYVEEVGAALDWLLQLNPADWRAAFPTLAAYPWDLFDYAAEDSVLSVV